MKKIQFSLFVFTLIAFSFYELQQDQPQTKNQTEVKSMEASELKLKKG